MFFSKQKQHSAVDIFSPRLNKFDLKEKLGQSFKKSKAIIISQALAKRRKNKMMFLSNLNNNDGLTAARKRSHTPRSTSELEIDDKIKMFNYEFNKNVKLHKDAKEENDEFFKEYFNWKKMSEEEVSRKPGPSKGPEKVFADLIGQYKEKGYKVPDLSVDKNLFKPSALLLEKHKLLDYYKSRANLHNNNQDKHLQFLENLNLLIIDKSSNEEEKKLTKLERKGTISRIKTLANVGLQFKENTPLNTEEIKREIKQNQEQMTKFKERLMKNKLKSFDTSVNVSNTGGVKSQISTICYDFDPSYIGSKNPLPSIKSKILKDSNHIIKISDQISPKDPSTTINGSVNTSIVLNYNTIIIGDKQTTAVDSVNASSFFFNPNENITSNNLNQILTKIESSPTNNTNRTILKNQIHNVNIIHNDAEMNKKRKIKNLILANSNDIHSTQNSFKNLFQQKSSNKNVSHHSTNNIFSRLSNSNISESIKSQIKLESLYENVLKRDQKTFSPRNKINPIYQEINTYFKENNKLDKILDRDQSLPKYLFRNLSDLKLKVGLKDVHSSFMGMSDKIGNYGLNINSLHNIKQMDKKINNMEKYLIKALNNEGNNIDY